MRIMLGWGGIEGGSNCFKSLASMVIGGDEQKSSIQRCCHLNV